MAGGHQPRMGFCRVSRGTWLTRSPGLSELGPWRWGNIHSGGSLAAGGPGCGHWWHWEQLHASSPQLLQRRGAQLLVQTLGRSCFCQWRLQVGAKQPSPQSSPTLLGIASFRPPVTVHGHATSGPFLCVSLKTCQASVQNQRETWCGLGKTATCRCPAEPPMAMWRCPHVSPVAQRAAPRVHLYPPEGHSLTHPLSLAERGLSDGACGLTPPL